MARVSLHGPGPCNLLELEWLHIVLAQKITWGIATYTGPITQPVFFCSSENSLSMARQRLRRVSILYTGHGTWPVYFISSLALWLFGFLLAVGYTGLWLCLHNSCKVFQQHFSILLVFLSFLFYSYALELLQNT